MPFTFSHPAIVLPFENSKRKWFSLTGLIVGSVVPDIEFLMRLRETNTFGHTWLGLIVFDIPAAFLLGFIFHNLVRDPLVTHAPKFFRERLSPLLSFNWTNYFKKHITRFFISVLIGIASHIFLDAFTHYDGAVAKRSSFFLEEIIIWEHPFPMYLILQVATSLAGGLYILWFILKMKKVEVTAERNNIGLYWLSLSLLTLIIFTVRVMVDKTHSSFNDIFIAAVGSFLYALLAVSLFYSGQKKSPDPVGIGGEV
jgi:4-amino-4-deoxy-L-arabinose transferase-like glycosyltransferase